MQNFDRSTVKHALHNDRHQWLDSSRLHQFVFGPDSLGILQLSSRPTSWFKGALLLREGKEMGRKEKIGEKGGGEGEKGKRRKGIEEKGEKRRKV